MWAARIFQLFPQLYLVPYLISRIGNSGYGIYALVWSLLLAVDTLQRSLQAGVVKYSAAFLAQDKTEEINKTLSSSFVFSCGIAITIGFILFSLSFLSSNQISNMRIPLIIISFFIVLIVPLTPYIALIQAKQCYYIGAISDTLFKYIGLIVVIFVFHFYKSSVNLLIVIMGLMLFLSKAVQVPFAYRIIPGLTNRLALFNKHNFYLILSYGTGIIFASICLAANSSGLRWLMNWLSSPIFVTHMVIMLTPSILLSQIVNPLAVTIMPATSAYEAIDNQNVLKQILVRGVRYIAVLVFISFIFILFLLSPSIKLWVGDQYTFLIPHMTVIFASTCFRESTSVAHHMLKGLGKIDSVVKIYFLTLVVIPLSLILLIFAFTKNPYIAVTIGLTTGYFSCGILQLIICSKLITLDIFSLFKSGYIIPFIFFSISYSFCKIISNIIEKDGTNDIFSLLICAMVNISLFIFLWYQWGSSKEDKSFFIDVVKRCCKIKRFERS